MYMQGITLIYDPPNLTTANQYHNDEATLHKKISPGHTCTIVNVIDKYCTISPYSSPCASNCLVQAVM